MDIPPASTPVACDMSTALDSPQERLAEHRRLFGTSLIDKERTDIGIRFRLNGDVESWVRDLSVREKACCPFFAFDVTVEDGVVVWDVAVSDSDEARGVLDELYRLPDTVTKFDLDPV